MLAVDLSLHILWRLQMHTLAGWLALSPTVRVHIIFIFITGIVNTIHTFSISLEKVILSATGPPACATSRAFVVASQSISACKATSTLFARMWTFSGVQFRVAFQVVQSAEACIACLTYIWLLLTVR